MSPENVKCLKHKLEQETSESVQKNGKVRVDSTCVKPSVFKGFFCQLGIFVVLGEDGLSSEADLTSRRVPKWVVAHLRDLL